MTDPRVEAAALGRLRDLTRRLGFGDDITEPMADNDTIIEAVDAAMMDQRDHWECPIVCELCGEQRADTECSHCKGSGGNLALIAKSGAYAECEWCAGAGKIHADCPEADAVAPTVDRDTLADLISRAEGCRYCNGTGQCAECQDQAAALLSAGLADLLAAGVGGGDVEHGFASCPRPAEQCPGSQPHSSHDWQRHHRTLCCHGVLPVEDGGESDE